MIFADAALARRLEAAEAANARGCIHQDGAAVLEVGGGAAIFVGPQSPLTQAVGMGLNGPVPISELRTMEEFFRSRGARPVVDLCPLAHAGLLEALAAREYRASEFNNVLVRSLPGFEFGPTPRVRRAGPGECERWSHAVGEGFFERSDLSEEEMDVGRAIFGMPGALCYVSAAETGEAAGGGAMSVREGLATLFADSTVARFRSRGLHRELIIARLAEGLDQGCDLATASTLPGSLSQRNYQRLGFFVVYTKLILVGPLEP
jgi:hypothetical protein